jgi:signal transduction histidine kinase
MNEAASDTLLLDPTQLSQTIVNLCINADHAIGAKTGTIKIRLKNVSFSTPENSGGIRIAEKMSPDAEIRVINGALPAGEYLCLSIEDNGEGMTREVAERIFDPFFTTKGVGVGTGLGLAAIQGIVHDHGGAIVVTTARFKGSCFDILLPMTSSTDE